MKILSKIAALFLATAALAATGYATDEVAIIDTHHGQYLIVYRHQEERPTVALYANKRSVGQTRTEMTSDLAPAHLQLAQGPHVTYFPSGR